MRWMLTIAGVAVIALLLALSVEDKPRSESSRTPVDSDARTTRRDEPTTPHRPVPPTTRQVEVRVVGDGDGPVQNALVRFLVAGDEKARADTDEKGRARIDISAEGRVAVTRCAPYRPAVSKPVGDRDTITVHLSGGTLAIAGTIVDEDGNPIEATVMAKLGDPDPWVGEWHWVGRRVVQPKGQFRIEGLAPGRYVVTAPGPKGTTLSGEVTIEAGRIHEVKLR